MTRTCWWATAVAIAVLAIPSTTAASPWVTPKDEMVIKSRFDFQQARREFLEAGEVNRYSLNGRYRAATFATTLQIGLVDRLEIGLSLPLKLVSYRADPVVLLPCSGPGKFGCYQNRVIQTSDSKAGLADIDLSATYQFLRGRFVGAFKFTLKTPTGYKKPAGTFGDNPKSPEEFAANPGEYVDPDNVEDDVTLGPGTLDLSLLAQFGWALPSRTFLRFGGGYRLRLMGGGDQIVGALRVGQKVGNRLILTAGTSLTYSVQKGRRIGVTVTAKDPTLPAEEYRGVKNLRLREERLSYDALEVYGGILLQVSDSTDLNLSYSRVVWGRNTALVQTLSLGVGFKFDYRGGD